MVNLGLTKVDDALAAKHTVGFFHLHSLMMSGKPNLNL